MNTHATQKILIEGQRIGYQFNKKSQGKRRALCIVHNFLGATPWIRYAGMVLEVRRLNDSYAYEWEAVKQIPQEVAGRPLDSGGNER